MHIIEQELTTFEQETPSMGERE